MSLTQVNSNLSDDLERLARRVIGCCLNVHRELGPGMSESVYHRACRIEFEANGLAVEIEKPVPIRYRGQVLCTQRIDLLVEGQLVVEVKSLERINKVHVAQAVSYLRATSLRIALVVNFNVAMLKQVFGGLSSDRS
jgi:GxxExxY protein